MFIFGLDADEVERLRQDGYNPLEYYHGGPELKKAVDMIGSGFFSPEKPDLFRPIVDSWLRDGDYFLVLADFAAYARCQEEVGRVFSDPEEWTRRAILNVARMDRFSTDHTISQYVEEIWRVKPIRRP